MEFKQGYLGFNGENGRYGVLSADLWMNDGLHCGTSFQAKVAGEWIDTRIEMAENEWYLVGTNLKGKDLENIRVRFESEDDD